MIKENSEKTKNPQREIYLIRHGQRSDIKSGPTQFSPTTKLIKNPTLTYTGKYQAYTTGRFLHTTHLAAYNQNTEICIMSSPYLRCLQTAQFIAESLKMNKRTIQDNTIYVTEFLKEYQGPKNFATKTNLEYKWKKKFKPKGLKVKQLEGPLTMDVNREKVEDSYKRSLKFFNLLRSENLEVEGKKPKVIICVSHAFYVINLVLQYGKVMESHSPIDYCSTTKLVVDDWNSHRLELVNSDDHISHFVFTWSKQKF